MKYLLDTNVLIHILRGHDKGSIKEHFKSNNGRMFISAVTVDELMFGICCAPKRLREKKQEELNTLLSVIPILDFNEDAAEHSSQIRYFLKSTGQLIGSYDNMIAGHARSLELTVITNNTKEFCRVPGLEVEDWSQPLT
ncbi:PIN domain-containing protein [Endozoicomonas sp. 4G]|uniref:PIN domain-containing protein n=1 Tax=Endozoicomonas sp. 4G TaxID=2872754 RepID=UPI0020785CA8|nr:PIN domain-containing protein [Endozoicomonas sp. 4G]